MFIPTTIYYVRILSYIGVSLQRSIPDRSLSILLLSVAIWPHIIKNMQILTLRLMI